MSEDRLADGDLAAERDMEREAAETEDRLVAAMKDPEMPGLPVAASDGSALVFPQSVVNLLNQPLDQDRVKSRQGRGGGSFDYLAIHDIVRAANRIFGFGGWGHRIVEQVEIGAVEVVSSGGKPGWHVAYRCVVELSILNARPVAGSGYGDGVEYGPAARITACELALKESESDALKRAFKNLGDQFGLILYAKTDERARIERDTAADQARQIRSDAPVTMEEALARLAVYVEAGNPWVKEAAEAQFDGVTFTGKKSITEEQWFDLLRRLQTVTLSLDAADVNPAEADAETMQRIVRGAFSTAFDGRAILGPDPFKPAIPF